MGKASLHIKLNILLSQAASGDFPHVLLYGPSGAGKKVRSTASSCTCVVLLKKSHIDEDHVYSEGAVWTRCREGESTFQEYQMTIRSSQALWLLRLKLISVSS